MERSTDQLGFSTDMAIRGKTKSRFAKTAMKAHKGGRKMHSSPKASSRATRGTTRY